VLVHVTTSKGGPKPLTSNCQYTYKSAQVWHGGAWTKLRMSALGQKQTEHVRVMSALPPKADIANAVGMSAKCRKTRH